MHYGGSGVQKESLVFIHVCSGAWLDMAVRICTVIGGNKRFAFVRSQWAALMEPRLLEHSKVALNVLKLPPDFCSM